MAGLWPLAGNYDISIEEYLIGLGDTGFEFTSLWLACDLPDMSGQTL
jgi:hypothetical protein